MTKPLTPSEWLQLQLDGVHRQAQQDDAHHQAAIRADVAHRWPSVQAWLKERSCASTSR